MRCEMMGVISSLSISTTGFFTLIFAIADEPLRARICDRRSAECLRTPALWRGGAHPARTKHMRAELRARTRRAIVRARGRLPRSHAAHAAIRRVGLGKKPHGGGSEGGYGAAPGRLRRGGAHRVFVAWPRRAAAWWNR